MADHDTGERSGQPRRKRICGRMPSPPSRPPVLVLPKTFHNDQWTNIDLDPKCSTFLPFVRQNKKRSKVGKIKWVLEEGGGTAREQFLPVIPPKLEGEGRVREGRGWVGEPRVWPGYGVALLQGSRGGYNKRRQPDSSLNCRGLAASSWCEGLECGRPAQAYQAYEGLPAPRSTPPAALSVPDDLNMSHFLACRLVANLSGSSPAET